MDPKKLALIAALLGTGVAIHGITSKKWSEAHTFLLVVGIIGFLGGGGTAGVTANI